MVKQRLNKLKELKEIEELKSYYWMKFCHELYEESEKELYPKSKFWERFTGIFKDRVKELQWAKFEAIWNKMLNYKEGESK